MAATTDPLLALRQAIKSKTRIGYVSSSGDVVPTLQDATALRLSGSLTLPKATPSRFRKPTATGAEPGDFVSLEALYVAWLARDAPVAEYMRYVREAGVGAFVSITERKGVVEWLEGRVTEHERIAPLAGESCVCRLGLHAETGFGQGRVRRRRRERRRRAWQSRRALRSDVTSRMRRISTR